MSTKQREVLDSWKRLVQDDRGKKKVSQHAAVDDTLEVQQGRMERLTSPSQSVEDLILSLWRSFFAFEQLRDPTREMRLSLLHQTIWLGYFSVSNMPWSFYHCTRHVTLPPNAIESIQSRKRQFRHYHMMPRFSTCTVEKNIDKPGHVACKLLLLLLITLIEQLSSWKVP